MAMYHKIVKDSGMITLNLYNVYSEGRFIKRFTNLKSARKFVFMRSGEDLFGNNHRYDIVNVDTGELVPLCT